MSNIEKIRQEIERRKKENMYIDLPMSIGRYYEDRDLLSFIDSLPEENNPEPYNPVYDEDYLNEKIAKATKSWEGVNVNKMLADCRGYKEKPSEDLREEIEMEWDSFNKHLAEYDGESEDVIWLNRFEFENIAKYFYEHGKKDMKEEMLKDAVEGEVVQDAYSRELRAKTKDLRKYNLKFGDKIKLIIIKD